jgi:tRNA 2-thiouridine synthesizing protein A
MSETMDEQDEITIEALLCDLKIIRETSCTNCGKAICGHEALMSLTMGFKNEPRCWHCLAYALGHGKEALRDRMASFITSRLCYNEGWLWANQEEGTTPGEHPRCLWPEHPAAKESLATLPEFQDENGIIASSIDATYVVEWDAGGMACGDLVLELRTRMQPLEHGQIFKVLATDPGAEKDLPSWCRMTGNALLAANHPIYLIRKKIGAAGFKKIHQEQLDHLSKITKAKCRRGEITMRRFIISVSALLIIAATVEATEEEKTSRYDKAWALYQQGPEKAEQVIKVLREELKENPENSSAHLLLGITLFGTKRFEAALVQFNAAIDLGIKRNVTRPRTILLKARTLNQLNRAAEAKKLLDKQAPLFSQPPDVKQEYDQLCIEISASLLKNNYIRMTTEAIVLAESLLKQELNEWVAIPLKEKEWKPLMQDKDLAPYLSPGIDSPELTAIILFPQDGHSSKATAIYFSKGIPVGYLKAKVGNSENGYVPFKDVKIPPADSSAMTFEAGSISSDNGIRLFTFKIKRTKAAGTSMPTQTDK